MTINDRVHAKLLQTLELHVTLTRRLLADMNPRGTCRETITSLCSQVDAWCYCASTLARQLGVVDDQVVASAGAQIRQYERIALAWVEGWRTR